MFFWDGIDRSYIIKVAGVRVEVLGFISEIFNYYDAADHEYDVLFSNHLKLVGDGSGVDTESGIKFDLEGVTEVIGFVMFSGF